MNLTIGLKIMGLTHSLKLAHKKRDAQIIINTILVHTSNHMRL